MAIAFRVPVMGNGLDDIILIRWLKGEGERIKAGENVVEVELNKGVTGLESGVDGVLLSPLVIEGEIIRENQVLCYIGEPGEQPEDGLSPGGDREKKTRHLRGHQRTIARKVSRSLQEKPVIHVNTSIDMAKSIEFMSSYHNAHPDVELRYDDLFIFVLARLLKGFPHFLEFLRADEIVQHTGINIGFAISIGDDLFIPVIRDAEKKDVGAISGEVESMVNRAFDHVLTPADVSDSCIILSNLGMYAIESFDAIIYPEHSASLAIGSISKIPVVHDDEVVIRPAAKVTLTVDHRLINGKEAAQFLSRFKSRLEKGKFTD